MAGGGVLVRYGNLGDSLGLRHDIVEQGVEGFAVGHFDQIYDSCFRLHRLYCRRNF